MQPDKADPALLVHEYGEIEDDLLWRVATVRIPNLIAALEPLVPVPPQTGG